MELDELRHRVHSILNPEREEDWVPREFAHPGLATNHGLDTSYLMTLNWEGSSTHSHTRICSDQDHNLHTLTRNSDVSTSLFGAGLRLFADSIVEYNGKVDRKGRLRYYPPVILTFWSGFETFVRYTSELMLITVRDVPEVMASYLRDLQELVESGRIKLRVRRQTVLERYAVLLKYGYSLEVDRGSRYWQCLQAASKLRDYYTHLDVTDPRSISTTEVKQFMESVLLGIITPSVQLRRTLLLGVYDMHYVLSDLCELAEDYTEQPFFKDWPMEEGYLFHCNFENVDETRFPTMEMRLKRKWPGLGGQGTS
jgi:hypothetical protein